MPSETLAVIPSERVQSLFARPQFVAEKLAVRDAISALQNAKPLRREVAERESSMRQAVAYATLRCGDDFLCLTRPKQANSELEGRWTVVFGGHVNAAERDGVDGLRRCLLRELREEFGRLAIAHVRLIGLVADPDSEVGRRHLGFVFEAVLRASDLKLDRAYDNEEYAVIPGMPRFAAIDALLNAERRRFDPWSQLILGAYSARPEPPEAA